MKQDKIRLPKNTVQETLLMPLYARRLCTERFPELFCDEEAGKLLARLEYDFREMDKKSKSAFYEFGALEVAMRQNDLQYEVRDYLKDHPHAAVVNLGCGLDLTGRVTDNGLCQRVNIDLPEVMEIRNLLLPPEEREKNLAADLKDDTWMGEIPAEKGAVFFAAGVFYYFTKEEIKTLLQKMEQRFPGARIVFDACNQRGVRMMMKTWLKTAKIKDIGAYFSVADTKEIEPWFQKSRVSSRPYMEGYQSLKGTGVRPLFRLLSRIGDKWIKMKIVRIDIL